MPDPKFKKVGTMSIDPTQTPAPATEIPQGLKPIGKMMLNKPFSETIENGSPELIPVSITDNFTNRFGLMKDQIELSMYEGFKAKAHDTEGMISDMWKDFLDNRIKTQNEDIAYQAKHIDWSKEDMKPFTMSDIIQRPAHFFSNQLPELLGQSIGSMTEPIMAGAIAGSAVGSLVGPEGTVLGMSAGTMGGLAAGLVGLGTGRFLESMSEAGSAYTDAVKYLKKSNPGMSDDQVHQKATEVLDHVFSRNMALGLADIPEIALAFVPAGKMFGKFTSKAFRNTISGIKLAGVPLIEATEEGLQYYVSESGQNKVRKAGDQKDLSLSAMWNNDEFQTSIQSGMLLGGLLGGAGKVSEHVFKSKEMLDSLPEAERIKQVSQLHDDFIFKKAQEGKISQLTGFLHDQGELSNGLFSDPNIKDEYSRIGDSKQKAREAVKQVKEKEAIHNAVVANKNIVHPDSLVQAYRNSIEIEKIDKAVDSLGSAEALNKGEIQKLELRKKHLGDINGLIGQGFEIEKDKPRFIELLEKHKEEIAKIQEKEKKKDKPAAAEKPKPSPPTAKKGKVETLDNITKNYDKDHPVEVLGEKGEGLTDAIFKGVAQKNGKVTVQATDSEGNRVIFGAQPEEVSFLQKEKAAAVVKPVKSVIPTLQIQEKNITKVHSGQKYSTSRTRAESDIKPGLYQLKDGTQVIVKAAKKIASIDKLKDPERWAKAEGFDSLEDLKKNAKPDLKAFANGKNTQPLWIHAFEKVGSEFDNMSEEEKADLKKRDNPQLDPENQHEPKTLQPSPEEEKAAIEKAKPKFKARSHDELIAKLEGLKITDDKNALNNVGQLIGKHIWNSGIDIAIAGIKAHGNVQRAIKEAMEWFRSTPDYKKMTRKDRNKASGQLQGSIEKGLEEISKFIEAGDEENAMDQDFESEMEEYEQMARDAGIQYEDNEGRVKAFINPLRGLYKGIEGLPERKAFDMLYDLFHDKAYSEKDVRVAIGLLPDASLIKALEVATDAELIQLSNALKNVQRVPFIHHLNIGKRDFKTYVSNTAKDVIFDSIRTMEEMVSNVPMVKKQLEIHREKLNKLIGSDPRKSYSNPAAREAVFNLELETLKNITGEDWTLWANAKIPATAKEKTYLEYYKNNLTYPDSKTGKLISLQRSALRNFLLKDFEPKDVIDRIKSKSEKHKSNIGQLADLKGRNTEGKLGNYFDNIMNKRKSGYVLRSHIIDAAAEIHTVDKPYLKGNRLVDYFKNLGTAAKVFIYDGIKNETTGSKEETGSLSESDFMLATLLNFITPGALVSKNEFMMPVEQLSDKKQTVFVQAPKYTLEEVKKMISETPEQYRPTNKELKDEVALIERFISDNQSSFGEVNAADQARLFVSNYAVNKYYSDLYYQGRPENYIKKGKFDYVGQVKRAGSAHSSGVILNMEIEGGIGATSNHIVVNNIKKEVEVNGKLYTQDIADGQTFHTKEWDERVKKSSGGIFHTILKPIYSAVDAMGNRILIKSNSILLSEKYASEKDDKGNYIRPVLHNLLTLMQKNNADYLTVESGVKHDAAGSVTQLDWNTGTSSNVVVNERDNKNWRIQQDFNQPEKMDWKRLTKQMMRHMMDFKSWGQAQELINAAERIEKEKLDNIFSDPAALKKFIVESLEDNDTNRHVLQLLNNGASLDHPHLRNFIQTVASSAITKRMLDIKGNGAIYIEMTSAGTDLQPGECLVPENSGLKIGEKIFATRVPSSNHHSTAYVTVKGYIPAEMGNVIVLHAQDMKKAGADFDGDARHIWGLSKQKHNLIDDVFRIAEAEYLKPENQERINSPIDTDSQEEIFKNSDYSKKVGNKYLLSSLLYMYNNNKDGKKVVGIVATSSKIFSFLRAHKAKLKMPISMPLLKKGEVIGTLELSEVKTDDATKDIIANNINQAVDAAKLQNLIKMGMTEAGASIYCMLEQLGLSEEHTVNFMANPVVRQYLDSMGEAQSVNSTIDQNEVIDRLALFYDEYAFEEDSEGRTKFPKYPQDIELTADNIANPLSVLQKVKYLKSLSDDYFKFGSVINLSEKSPKTFSELYKAGNDLLAIMGNETHFEMDTTSSPYMSNAKLSLEASKKFYRKNTIFGTKRAKAIIDTFETMLSYRQKDGNKRPLNKERIKALSDAIGNILMAEVFRNNKGKEDIRKSVNAQFKAFKEPNKFLDLLMVDESLPEEKQKLQLKPEFQREELDAAEVEAIQNDFAALPPELKEELVLNTYYQHGFLTSRKIGGYSLFLDSATHKDLSEKLSAVKQSWDTEKNDHADIKDLLKEIVRNNPFLVPDANLIENKNGMEVQKGAGQLRMPMFVKKKIGNKYKVFTRLKDSSGATYYNPSSQFNFEAPIYSDVKTYVLSKVKLQEESEMSLSSEDSELDQSIKKHFKELYPNANVKFVDSVPSNKDALGAFIGNTFYINPKLATQDTYFHEFAHGYWAALPDNDSVKAGLLEIFGTEEKAVQAIGEAGVNIAKVDLKGSTMARFKGLLTSFWRKVKAVFGIQTKEDMARAFAERMWKNSDKVNLGTIHSDFIKYQLSRTAGNTQDNISKELEKALGKPLSQITIADLDMLRGTNKKMEEEVAEMLPEGEVLEDVMKSPKKLFHILADASNKALSITKYSIAKGRGSYISLSKPQKVAVDQDYQKYLKDVAEVETLWNYFPTIESFNNISEVKRVFNKLGEMDPVATKVLYDTLNVKYAEEYMLISVRREATDGFTGYKSATVALNDIIYGDPKDFKYKLSQWFTSDIDLQDTHAPLQWHTREMAEDMARAQMDWSALAKNLQKLEQQIVKEGGSLKKLTTEKTTKGKKFIVFDKSLATTATEKAYIELVNQTNIEHGRGSASLMIPQITSNFFDLMKKFGIYKAIKQSFFGDSSYDGIAINYEGKVMTFKEAKNMVNLSKSNGLINNIIALKKLNDLESQAEDIFKNKKIDEAGVYWNSDEKNSLSLGHKFEADEYASDNINGVMMQYFKDLLVKAQMERHVVIAAYMQNLYKNDSTKFVRSWLENFYGNNIFKRNPSSFLGKYAKYLNFVMSLTAWRYLALNPMGMIFNMSAGATGSFRELGPVVMLRAMRRMASNPMKCRAIMIQQKVVNIDIDPELNQSEKYLKKIQAAAFSGITGAEYINQGYTYIGLLEADEWNSYDNKGNLITGQDGITEARHVEIMDRNQSINGAYGSQSRRPIGYTPEGRALMMFKNWLPDTLQAYFRSEGTDRHGNVRKGIFWTISDPQIWSKVFSAVKTKESWDSLSEVDQQNIMKFSRQLMISGMLLMLILSLDDDDDDNKAIIAGLRRSLGDASYVFDLDNVEFLFDSPVPVLGTMIDLKKAFEAALKGTTYQRAGNGHEKGDSRAVSDFVKLAPGHGIPDLLDGE